MIDDNNYQTIKLMDKIRSLHLKLGSMAKSFTSLDKKVNEVTESKQIGGKKVRKSAKSNNIVIKFLAGLHKLSHEELKNTLVEADAILNTVDPIPSDQILDATLEYNVTSNNLKTILVDVFDLLNSLPNNAKADSNNAVASTSILPRYVNSEVKEEKIQIWRKYKNRYNYIENYKFKRPFLNYSNKVVSIQDDVNGTVQSNANSTVQNNANSTVQNNANSTVQNNANSTVQSNANSTVQNNVNFIVQNNVNDNTQNNINDTAQIDLNEKKYSLSDIIQNEDVYEMFRSRLKNSPYDDPYMKNNVSSSKLLTLKLCNGETYVKPMSYVAPLIMLKKCDDLCPTPLQNKKTMDKCFPSTSNKTNDSNINNLPKTKMITRNRGANRTKDITNSFKTNVKTITEKRRSTIKNKEYETSKKKKK